MSVPTTHFKRANFFPGLMATPKFWNDMQNYQFSKENFYNRTFRGKGIVPLGNNSLRVEAMNRGGGTITLVVHPGVAIDGWGRSIFLNHPHAMLLDYKKFKIPGTIFIVTSYKEEDDEFFQNQEIPDYQGYQKKIETAHIDIVSAIHDNDVQLELARIYLAEDENGEIREIINSSNFTDHGPNSIDIRYVSWVSPARPAMSPYLKAFLVELLDATRNTASAAYDTLPLPGLRELQTVSLTGKMLVQCGDVPFEDVIHILYPLFDISTQILQEMLDYERENEKRLFTIKSDFDQVKLAVYRMGDQIKYFNHKFEELDGILHSHRQVIEGIKNLVVARQITLESIMLISYEFPRILLVGDDRYTLVDYLDLGDREALEAHEFSFEGCRDVSTSQQVGSYPDGTVVRDTVKRYVGGACTFSLKNIVKRRKLMIIRRTDIFHGNYGIDIVLNTSHSRVLMVDGIDTKDRWRNLIVQFDEDEVSDNRATLRMSRVSEGRDNFGRIWIYQSL